MTKSRLAAHATAFVAIILCSHQLHAAVQQSKAPARPVVRAAPVMRAAPLVRPGVPAKPGVAGKPGAPGTPGATGARVQGATAGGGADPRSQLMEMVKPGISTSAVHSKQAVLPASANAPLTRTSFAKPANVPHDPNHHVGSVGNLHRHAAFMFGREGHRFYRRYYKRDGAWFWYDEEAPADPAGEDVSALPSCEAGADECQGNVVPLANAQPDAAFAPTDPGQ
jgi:hypothetical protein